MERAAHTPIEELTFFGDHVIIADWAWTKVSKWPRLAQNTVGQQLIRAIDCVGASLVEGDGRLSDSEAAHFFTIARGSARETRFWIQRAVARGLINSDQANKHLALLTDATRQLNGLIRYRRPCASKGRVREDTVAYVSVSPSFDPFTDIASLEQVTDSELNARAKRLTLQQLALSVFATFAVDDAQVLIGWPRRQPAARSPVDEPELEQVGFARVLDRVPLHP
jgi:four helix bundle protein